MDPNKIIPLDSVPDVRQALGEGGYIVEIDTIEPRISTNGNYMLNVSFRVAEPAGFAGGVLFYSFTIGTAADPTAEDPNTWNSSVGAKMLKKMMQRAQVETKTMTQAVLIQALTGKRVGVYVERVPQPATFRQKDGTEKPNPKAGKVFSEITDFFSRGERQLGPIGPKPMTSGYAVGSPIGPPAAPVELTCPIAGCGEVMPAYRYGEHIGEHASGVSA